MAAIDCYRGAFMQLYLCDTHTQEDFYVHSTLQTEGHALPWAKAEYLEVSALKWVEVSLENLNIYVALQRHLIYLSLNDQNSCDIVK